jgi:hypothetical protein
MTMMKKYILFIFLFISCALVGVYFFSHESEQKIQANYRHHYTKKEKIALKKARMNETYQKNKKQNTANKRELAQEDIKTVKVANPNRKKEEFKEDYSLRGRDSLYRNSREPSSKIVYGDGKGNEYRLLQDFYAVKKTPENENDFPYSQLKLGYFIVPKDAAPTNALRVMENAQTGRAAIFTGLIKVKLNDIGLADNVVRDFNYEIVYQYDHISLVMYQFSDFTETMNAKKSLDQNPAVKRATIELLEYERIEQ